MAALLALGGALCWGIGDFCGGLASRRIAVLTVLAISQSIGLLGVLLWIVAAGEHFPGVDALWPAAAGGIAGLVGLGALYRGFAIGAIGIVAPISAAYPLVPLGLDAAQGITPGAPQWLGIVLIVAGVVTLSREPGSGSGRLAAGAGLALLAAAGFGLFIVGLDAGADESAPWAVVAARFASASVALCVVAATSRALRAPQSVLPLVVMVGIFDTLANVLVAAASTHGAAGIVAVLSALYPVVTIVLARVVLHEKLDLTRRVGGGVALSGAALVAAG